MDPVRHCLPKVYAVAPGSRRQGGAAWGDSIYFGQAVPNWVHGDPQLDHGAEGERYPQAAESARARGVPPAEYVVRQPPRAACPRASANDVVQAEHAIRRIDGWWAHA